MPLIEVAREGAVADAQLRLVSGLEEEVKELTSRIADMEQASKARKSLDRKLQRKTRALQEAQQWKERRMSQDALWEEGLRQQRRRGLVAQAKAEAIMGQFTTATVPGGWASDAAPHDDLPPPSATAGTLFPVHGTRAEKDAHDRESVLGLQVHKCTQAYCQKGADEREKRGQKRCRFGFPKELRVVGGLVFDVKLKLKDDSDDCDVRVVSRFEPARDHPYVCAYSLPLLRVLRANCNVQWVTGMKSVLFYVVSYAAKSERASTPLQELVEEMLHRDDNADGTTQSPILKAFLRHLAGRDVSQQEAVSSLAGLPYITMSMPVVAAPTLGSSAMLVQVEGQGLRARGLTILQAYGQRLSLPNDRLNSAIRDEGVWGFRNHSSGDVEFLKLPQLSYCQFVSLFKMRSNRVVRRAQDRVVVRFYPCVSAIHNLEQYSRHALIRHRPWTGTAPGDFSAPGSGSGSGPGSGSGGGGGGGGGAAFVEELREWADTDDGLRYLPASVRACASANLQRDEGNQLQLSSPSLPSGVQTGWMQLAGARAITSGDLDPPARNLDFAREWNGDHEVWNKEWELFRSQLVQRELRDGASDDDIVKWLDSWHGRLEHGGGAVPEADSDADSDDDSDADFDADFDADADADADAGAQASALCEEQAAVLSIVQQAARADCEPVRMQVPGVAGTGKTFLIKTIVKCLPAGSVVVMAPTGVVATSIDGRTLHSGLTLPVPLPKDLPQVSAQRLSRLQPEWTDVMLVIVDEISMVSQRMLNCIDCRLRQLKGNSSVFGGLSVVICGDFGQLPPVFLRALYSRNTDGCRGDIAGGALFREYFLDKVVRLKRVFRQEDPKFAEFLGRVRTGDTTQEDYDYIAPRMVRNLTDEELESFADATHIFSTNKEVDEHNDWRMRVGGNPVAVVKPESSSTAAAAASDKVARYPKLQTLELGGRAMLLRNVCTDLGLVNGATGRVVSILYKPGTGPPDLPVAVLLEMDHGYKGPPLFSTDGSVLDSDLPFDVTRTIVLQPNKYTFQVAGRRGTTFYHHRIGMDVRSFYAATVHKVQGATLSRVVAHPYPATGRRVRRPGIMYVVLSRVRRWVDLVLQDLTLHDFQLDKNSKTVKDWLALEATLDERDAITMAEYLTRQAAAAMEEEEEE